MEFANTIGGSNEVRTGKQHRINNDRYFHVMGQGWYALTREGLGGPFLDKPQAQNYVKRVMSGELVS